MKHWQALRYANKLIVLKILNNSDINILMNIFIIKGIPIIAITSLIVEAGLIIRLSYSTIYDLADMMIVSLEKESSIFSTKCLQELKAVCDSDNIFLFLFVIALLTLGSRFFHYTKFMKFILPLLDRFYFSGLYNRIGIPHFTLISKLIKIIYVLLK